MATRNVPGDYPTVVAAVAAADPGDTILIAASYQDSETVTVTVDNLIFCQTANATGIELRLDGIVTSVTLAGNAPFAVSGTGNDETIIGNSGANYIVGGGGNDTLDGGAGDDVILGLHNGTSTLIGGAGNDWFGLFGVGGTGTVNGGTGVDTVASGDLQNYSFTAVETLDTSAIDASIGQLSSFKNIIDSASSGTQIYIGLYGAGGTIDFSRLLDNTDSVDLHAGFVTAGYTVTGSVNNDILSGSYFDDTLNGGDGADTIFDGEPDDTDTLDGGAGNDRFVLYGGSSASGTVNGGTGNDTVQSHDLGNYSFTLVETLDSSSVNATITQLSEFNRIIDSGFSTSEIQISLRGAGGTIDFTNLITGADSISIYAGELTSGYAVTGSVNGDFLGGSGFDDTLRGGAGNDTLIGNGGVDTLEGGAGNDYLSGGGNGDTASYASATAGVIVNLAITSAQYTRGAGTDTLSGISNLTGSSFGDTLSGDGEANRLDGGIGADSMSGGAGNDSYIVDNAGDLVLEVAGNGTDTVSARVSYALAAGQSVEILRFTTAAGTGNLNLTGNEFDQTLSGNNGANRLDGGGGADRMTGYGGDDSYYVDNAGDLVFEAANGGTDTVFASISYALRSGQSVEALRFTTAAGTADMDLTGNRLAQTLYGNAGDNILDGGGGGDTMRGFGGDDTYVINSSSDRVFEASGQGSDTVNARVSYVLAAGQSVETLRFTTVNGTADLDLTGNAFNQTLIGNNGANHLDGGRGVDLMRGYGGDDRYFVDNTGDRVFEAAGGGHDTVFARASYVLQSGQSIETLRASSVNSTTAMNLTGNELAQSVHGNAGDNILDGKGGSDLLQGYGGSDTFVFSTALGSGNIDHIIDFSTTFDTIRLDRTVFSALGLGTLDADAFKDIGVAGAVVDANDRILYNHNTGELFYDSNGSAAGGRVEFAILDNKPANLSHTDFFVVS